MEYCSEGTLETVCREGHLDMCCARRYTHFLLKGVAYIHKKLIIHRDIKRMTCLILKNSLLLLTLQFFIFRNQPQSFVYPRIISFQLQIYFWDRKMF